MALKRKSVFLTDKKPIEQYDHSDKKRKNNPPVGLVTADTEKDADKKTYAYDPHLDPRLEWAGKKEHTSFEVPTVSLHVHERIDPKTIIEAVRKRNGGWDEGYLPLFESLKENPPLREALDFYKHSHNWSNRLIAGDSLLVMNSLIEKEGMAGQVQMVYIDPPYGISYGSNFQPFVNNRVVKDGKDEDLTQEPEMIRAFRDTWELGIHSYLTYLRDRLLLARELLVDSGSCFVQISDENVHLVRNLMDEVFGPTNFVSQVTFKKTNPLGAKGLGVVSDYLVWYARDKDNYKFHRLLLEKQLGSEGVTGYAWVELPNGKRRRLTAEEFATIEKLPSEWKLFAPTKLTAAGLTPSCVYAFEYEGKKFTPKAGTSWRTNKEGMQRLIAAKRLISLGDSIYQVMYFDDYPVTELTNLWADTRGEMGKTYVVQTATKVIERCLLMCTDPGDLVIDPTCGSGTTAVVAEQWGRRWIVCDTSRVATTLAKQRLMTALYDYYELAHPHEGISSGFKYKTVPHVTLRSIAQNEPSGQEVLYDRPAIDRGKVRISGPFTVEAVPAPTVRPLDSTVEESREADSSVARTGTTSRQSEWRAELVKTGIRGKGKQLIEFARIEPLPGTKWLHADGETKGVNPERVVISFGPEHAPLEQKQVELAWEEARTLSPKPTMILFASFEFDPEAAKDIDELTQEKTGMTFLKIKMNNDLLTEDLKKQRSSNQSFWLMGQPDVAVREIKKGEDKGKYQVEIHGFDYYNTKTGAIESGDTSKIAVWMLDTDYDSRSLYPRQVFFPMVGQDEGWARLAKNLKAEIDQELIEAYRGTVSLPFELGKHKRVAVKIVDDRGIESLKVIEVG
ncbi:MAG: site-specific DNA-methyltransferase [Elusimicrobia bacterium]|nr:site-specific DNA-methyltransferase [Elusimicrobiota bacterium]